MFAIATFLLFTGTVAVIAFVWTRRDDHQSATGYFLAGRSLPWIVVAGSLLLTNLSTEQLVGINGGAYAHGMMLMAWEVFAAVAMIIMAVVFLPRYLRGGIATVPQFLEQRYDKATRRLTGFLFLLSLTVGFMPFVLYSGAVAMNGLFEIETRLGVSTETAIWLTVVAVGLVGGAYAVLGGLKAVAVSDTINGAGLFIGGLMIPVLGLMAVGDGSFAEGLRVISREQPERLNPIGAADSNIPWGTLITGMLLVHLFYWCTNQAIVQRTFGARSLAEGQKGLLFAASMKLLGPLYLVLPGVIAWHLFQGNLPDQDQAYPALVREVLPPALVGFFGAVIFGAVLSSFNSALNSASTVFSLDIYRGLLRPEATDREVVRAGRICGCLLVAVAIIVAPTIRHAPAGLFDLMKQITAFFEIPLLTVIVVGFFTKHVSALAAKVGLLVGMGNAALLNLVFDRTFFGIELHWLYVAFINFVLMVLVMLVVGRLAPRKTAYVPYSSGEVDLAPWRGLVPAIVLVLLGVAGVYLLFTWLGVR